MTTSRSTRIWATVAMGVALVAAAGPACAADTPNPRVTTSGATTTLKVFAHGTTSPANGGAMSAHPTAKPKVGEVMAFGDELSQDGVQVGSDSVRCTVLAEDKLRCTATETFGNGTITLTGTTPMLDGEDFTIDVPIVSGTGAYEGATGTMHLVSVPGTHGADGNMTFTYTTASKVESAKPAATKSATTTQVTKVPSGGADTGGGSTAGVEHGWLLGLGALTAAAGAGMLAFGRRGR